MKRTATAWLCMAVALLGCGDDGDDDGDGGVVDAGSADGAAPDAAADAGVCRAVATSTDPTFQAYLDFLSERMTARQIPGLAVAVLDAQGNVRHQALLGGKGPEACPGPLTSDTRFRAGPVAAAFTATAVVAAASDGLLGLDDPITRYVPELTASAGDPAQIRVGHLLNFTAGLPTPFDATCAVGGLAGWVAAHNDLPIWFAPGTAYQMGFHQPVYAALALERAAGAASFEDFVRTRVFARLGMDSTFSPAVALAGDHATGSGQTAYPDCVSDRPIDQVFVSLADMIKFTRFLLVGDPGLMSPALHAKLLDLPGAPHFYPHWSSGYAMSRIPYASDGTVVYDVTGMNRGFGLEITMAPARNVAVVVMINKHLTPSNWPLNELALRGIDLFGPFAGYQPGFGPRPVSTWGEYAGTYVDSIGVAGVPPPRNFEVSFDGAKLWLGLMGTQVELTPDPGIPDEDVFVMTFLGRTTALRFSRDARTGVPTMIGTRYPGELGPPAFRTP